MSPVREIRHGFSRGQKLTPDRNFGPADSFDLYLSFACQIDGSSSSHSFPLNQSISSSVVKINASSLRRRYGRKDRGGNNVLLFTDNVRVPEQLGGRGVFYRPTGACAYELYIPRKVVNGIGILATDRRNNDKSAKRSDGIRSNVDNVLFLVPYVGFRTIYAIRGSASRVNKIRGGGFLCNRTT